MIALWADANNWATLKGIVNQVINLINSMTNTTVPVGGILSYYGNINNAALFDASGVGVDGSDMEKFALCYGQGLSGSQLKNIDGSTRSTTPDLRGRFIYSYESVEPLLSTGGVRDVTLTATQSGIREHYHNTRIATANGGENLAVGVNGYGGRTFSEGVIKVDNVDFRDGAQNAIESHTNMPPYIVLAYIIRYK